jgi:hypothetical protein
MAFIIFAFVRYFYCNLSEVTVDVFSNKHKNAMNMTFNTRRLILLVVVGFVVLLSFFVDNSSGQQKPQWCTAGAQKQKLNSFSLCSAHVTDNQEDAFHSSTSWYVVVVHVCHKSCNTLQV